MINHAYGADYWSVWYTWWIADAMGILIITPLGLVWSLASWQALSQPRQAIIERLALFILTIVISLWVFTQSQLPFLYLISPILIWGAFKLTLLGSILTNVIVATLVLGLTLNGYGPIALQYPHNSIQVVQQLQLFLGATVLPALAVAITIAAREYSETALRTSRQALYDQTQRLQLITDNMPALIGYVGTDLCFRFTNATYQEWFAETPQALVGQHLRDVIGESAYQLQHPYIDTVLAGEKVSFDLARADARGERFVHITYLPHCDDAGKVLGFYALVTDITERKALEAELFQEKEQAEITLASIADAVITSDASGRVTYLNPVAERLTGWTCVEAEGRPATEIFHLINEVDQKPVPDPITRCMHLNRPVGQIEQTILIHRRGHEYAIQDSAAPIYDLNGYIRGAVVVFNDVSEQRKLSRELSYQASHDELTGLVNRRELDRIQQALEEDRFQLYAQSLKALSSSVDSEKLHCELLLRLEDDQGRIITPDAFMPAAERL